MKNAIIIFLRALLKYNVPSDLHIFPKGEHKIGFINNPGLQSIVGGYP